MLKVKVLHVIGSLQVGGAGTVVMNYFRYINREKFTCDYLVFGNEIGEYEEEVYNLGGKVIRIPMPSDNYRQFRKNCIEIFKDGNYEIVHSHTLLNSGLVMQAARKAGIKVRVCHSHNIRNRPKENFVTLLYAQYMKLLIKKNSTHFLACARDAGRYLFGELPFDKDGIVINNGIETLNFIFNLELRNEVRNNLQLNGKFVVGNIGRLVEQKNQGQLLEIFKCILDKEPNAILLIAGDGLLKKRLTEKSKMLHIDHAVRFLGTRNDINHLLQAMDVFVFPSLFEGLGIVLIEAQAAGLRCYASDIIPKEAKVSDLVDFISLNEPAENWAKLILDNRDNYERKNMQRQILEAGYDIRGEVKKLENIYISALGINMEEFNNECSTYE